MAEKKNQHFIPQFLLKNFSSTNSKKCINTYIRTINEIKCNVSIATQCSKNYFYGKNLEIEDGLGILESFFSKELKKIIDKKEKLTNENRKVIYCFIALQIIRTLKNVEDIRANDEYINKNISSFEIEDEYDGTYLFEDFYKTIGKICDLEVSILKNNFESSFVISDNPIIIYNPYLENFNRQISLIGTVIIMPYSNDYIIILYDGEVYTRDSFNSINTNEDIDNLNLLQFIFSDKNIYFSNNIKNEKINKYSEKINKIYKDTFVKRFHTGKLVTVNTEKEYIKLPLSFIKIKKENQEYWELAKKKLMDTFEQLKKEGKINLTKDEEKQLRMPITFTRKQRREGKIDPVLEFLLYGTLNYVDAKDFKKNSILDLKNIK